ncbi:MAG: bifunctional anthranilate synthase component II/anthranilate phosphoribosyltransferase [Coriobacteriia bacterium]|nr:bifunctional anthranilate synthase component II/anthranilate phosphoribosyltransferase [Coriobacteriia bacterium]
MILVIDNYDSFTYNLVQILAALGAEIEVRRNDEVTADEAIAAKPAGIVISPGPGTPADAGVSADVVRAAIDAKIPVLGVCLGHQVIAEVFGGVVCRAPKPVHGKTDDIIHDGTDLFQGVPSPFTATRYHSLCVESDSVPESLEVQARTSDGIVMAVRHKEFPVFGVQFHPESVLTPEGTKVLANFLDVAEEVPLGRGSVDAPVAVAAAGGSEKASASSAEVTTIGAAISRVASNASLSEEEARTVMGIVMDGEATPAQISALIVGMRMKGETIDEIVGFARAMRERATPVRPAVARYVDTCGTGGDGLHTFNISTTTAFVVAGAGVAVAKHGNRAVSSSAGSADVLEALGVDVTLGPADMARCIDECGVGFLFAPSLHASMRHAIGPRREIGIRTVFNILGPLTNPAGAQRQLLGVYDSRLAPVIAEVAGRLGAERVLVVHGHPGMDEVSASGPTVVAEFDGDSGAVSAYEITPESVGIARSTLADIAGGDAAANAEFVRAVLGGEHGPKRDVVLLNCAAALVAAGEADDLADGVVRARESIDTGRALSVLEALVTVSQRLGEEARARAAKDQEDA